MKTFSIGRDANNEIILNNNFVSRRHAQLIISDNGQILIKDLGSSNGTFVNGNKVIECYLKPGDSVKCADIFLNWQQYALHSHTNSIKPVPLTQQVPENQVETRQVSYQQNNQSEFSSKRSDASFNSPGQNQFHTEAIPDTKQHNPVASTVQQNIVVMGKAKSVGMAFLLAFLFGPLGLLYASILGGIIMFFVSLVLFFLIPIVGYIIAWVGCIIWAVVAANQANAALQNRASGLINNNFQR